MYQKLSSFHLTHPTLIISYLHVIALIICNFLYPLGFIGSFYVLFFHLRTFFFYFILFFCFIFPPFLSILFFLFYPLFFHFLLSFLSSIFLHIVIYYFFFFPFSFFSYFLILYLDGNVILIITHRFPFLFYFDFLSFFIFSFLCLFSTFYIAYTFHIICAISIMHSNSFSLSIDRLT